QYVGSRSRMLPGWSSCTPRLPSPCPAGNLLRRVRVHSSDDLLDPGELRAGFYVVRLGRQGINLVVHVADTVSGVRMVAQELRATRPILALDHFKKLWHRARVIARVVQNVGAHQVGLFL